MQAQALHPDAGLSLERVRELISGAPEDPAPRRAAPGSIEVWSRVTVADGLEIQVEPGRADLTPDQMRSLTSYIGNLKPGDEFVLACRFAQLRSFEQGRLRVSIPTTIAPRYGHAEQAGLQPQQVPLARMDAEYPLALRLTLSE